VRRVVLLIFSLSDHIYPYIRVIDELAFSYLQWIYGSPRTPIPPFKSAILSGITDRHTLIQRLQIWDAAVKLVLENGKPLPSLRAIVPALIARWNSSKGGVDVVSRLLANATPSPYKVISLLSSLYDRLILMALVNVFRIYMWCSVADRLDTFKSFKQLRKAARRGHTLNEFLSNAMTFFRQNANNDCTSERAMEVDGVLITTPPVEQSRKTMKLFFVSAAGCTFRFSGRHLVKQMSEAVCFLCRKKTRYSCPLCKVHLCISVKVHATYHLPDECQSSCHMLWHDRECIPLNILS
jgi:hypothetical protein